MGDDIVERLRFLVDDGWYPATHTEAADEIERLRAENRRLTDENARAWNACDEACERKEQLQAVIDAYVAANAEYGDPQGFGAAKRALLAAATKEDDRD